MSGSVAYRTHADAIKRGDVPDKYLRLLPHITGQRLLEFGAAEGVLALLLADRDPQAQIFALERRAERHTDARKLQALWRAQGRRVDGCQMVCGDICDRFELLEGIETVVAIRTIYHLRDAIDPVFSAIAAAGVRSVVLAGNAGRARKYVEAQGHPTDTLGPFNYYASVPGMTDVLTRAGYTVQSVVRVGDPIVVGHR